MKLKDIYEKYQDIRIFKSEDINLDYIIWTTIGVYGDQSIEQIFEEKIEDINALDNAYKDGGYCLWALNKLNADNVRKFCFNCKDMGKPIYLLMKYTKSKSAGDKKEMYTSEHFDKEDIESIKKDYPESLNNLHLGENNIFPYELPHKETIIKSNASFGKAFVIDEIGALDSKINDVQKFLSKFYYNCSNEFADTKIGGNNDSGLLKLVKGNDPKNLFEKLDDTEQVEYYIAKLKPPFFVKLKLDVKADLSPKRDRFNK